MVGNKLQAAAGNKSIVMFTVTSFVLVGNLFGENWGNVENVCFLCGLYWDYVVLTGAKFGT